MNKFLSRYLPSLSDKIHEWWVCLVIGFVILLLALSSAWEAAKAHRKSDGDGPVY